MPYVDASGNTARLIDQLSLRLDCAHELAIDAQKNLASGNTTEIEAGIARLETVAQEFKLLLEEYYRLPEIDEVDARLAGAKRELREAVTRVARSSAIAGGLLERMLHVSRGRVDLFNRLKDGTYQPDGRSSAFDARGLRLKEWL